MTWPKVEPKVTKMVVLKLEMPLFEYLRAHAFRRDMYPNRMIVDILTSWVRRATPYNDPVFTAASLGYELPELRKEPSLGYFESLLFWPEAQVRPAGDEPAPFSRAEHKQRFPDEDL